MQRCAGVVPIAGQNGSTARYHLARHVGGGASARVSPSGAIHLHLRRRHGQSTSRPGSRAYFADRCDEAGLSDASSYAALSVLGKTLSFTVDLSQATCGCVVAAYLVPMRGNSERGSCDDFYCDANKVSKSVSQWVSRSVVGTICQPSVTEPPERPLRARSCPRADPVRGMPCRCATVCQGY